MKGKFDFVQTEWWKSLMAKLYGWGASLVIVGALFKLQHWPGAGPMLVLGMGTEAVIFFFSAFEPVHEEYDWKLVFPELAIKDEETLEKLHEERRRERGFKSAGSVEAGAGGAGNAVAAGGAVNLPNINVNIDQGSIDKVNNGLASLADAANKIADITKVTLAADDLSDKLSKASNGVESFNGQMGESTKKLGDSVDALSNSYYQGVDVVKHAGDALVDGVRQATESLSTSLKESASSMTTHFEKAGTTIETTIKESSKELASKVAQATDGLSSSFERVSRQVVADMEIVKAGYGNQQKNMEVLNKNLAILNSIYELQIQETDKHLKNSNALYQDVEEMIKDLRLSVEEAQKFRLSMHALNSNINSLNDIYGNMLSAMHSIQNN